MQSTSTANAPPALDIVKRDYEPKKFVSFSWKIPTSSSWSVQFKSAVFPSNSLLQWQLSFSSSKQDDSTLNLSLVRGAKFVNIQYFLVCSDLYGYRRNPQDKSGKCQIRQGQLFNFGLTKWQGQGQTCDLSLFIINEIPVVKVPNDSTLASDLKKAREEVNDINFFLGPNEEVVKASKFMLTARSSVFARMFETGMKERETNEVTIPDASLPVFKEMLSYIYTDDTPNIPSMAEELWIIADSTS